MGGGLTVLQVLRRCADQVRLSEDQLWERCLVVRRVARTAGDVTERVDADAEARDPTLAAELGQQGLRGVPHAFVALCGAGSDHGRLLAAVNVHVRGESATTAVV